ncbi:MAG TPA: NAD-dependent epimerase, partial [Actinomycetota bacterium]|nr:NAD-dependent epimerase [Actinomycetota bacterium]
MRVVIFGASGNVGTSLIRSLAEEDVVDTVVGVARRLPEVEMPKVRWETADIATSDLVPLVRGA